MLSEAENLILSILVAARAHATNGVLFLHYIAIINLVKHTLSLDDD